MNPKISLRYIGHATTLISIGGANILTDPHFGGQTLIFKRHRELNFDPSQLPGLTAVIVSHTHFDHLHIGSYKFISTKVPIIVPEGCGGAITKFFTNPIIELSYFASHPLPDGTEITAVPVKHTGGRYSQLRFTKANAYFVMRNGKTVFFAGDTAYGPHFEEIGNLTQIDLALIPISGYLPKWFMHHRHMTPKEAVKAFEDLKAKYMVPIHWGSFSLSLEPIGEPIELLTKIIEEREELKDKIHIVEHGGEITI